MTARILGISPDRVKTILNENTMENAKFSGDVTIGGGVLSYENSRLYIKNILN